MNSALCSITFLALVAISHPPSRIRTAHPEKSSMLSGSGVQASAGTPELLLKALSGNEMFLKDGGLPGTHPKGVDGVVSFICTR